MTETASDHALLTRYGNGDQRAFETLYERHKRPLYAYLRQRFSDAHVADDIFQEVWTKVIRFHDRYEPTATFSTWLHQIARNTAIDHVRQSARRPTVVPDGEAAVAQATGGTTPDDAAANRDLGDAIDRAMVELPDDQREAVLLKHHAGLTLAEIAEVTNTAQETVKSRLRYAVIRLRAALQRPASVDGGQEP